MYMNEAEIIQQKCSWRSIFLQSLAPTLSFILKQELKGFLANTVHLDPVGWCNIQHTIMAAKSILLRLKLAMYPNAAI